MRIRPGAPRDRRARGARRLGGRGRRSPPPTRRRPGSAHSTAVPPSSRTSGRRRYRSSARGGSAEASTGIGAVPPGAARDAVAGAPGCRHRLLRHERPGGGRRRARSRQDRRTYPVRGLERARERVRRPRRRPQARGRARASRRGGRTSSCSTAAACSCSRRRYCDADRRRRRHRDPRALAVSLASRCITESTSTDPRRMRVVRTLSSTADTLDRTARGGTCPDRPLLADRARSAVRALRRDAGAPDAASATDQNRAVVRSPVRGAGSRATPCGMRAGATLRRGRSCSAATSGGRRGSRASAC